MKNQIEIIIKFEHEFNKESEPTLEIIVDGHVKSFDDIDDDIKMQCISIFDRYYDKFYDEMMK